MPATRGSMSHSGVRVRWESSTMTASRRQSAIDGLSPAERRRWAMMTHPAGRDQFLLGRLMLREMASDMLGLPLESVTVGARCSHCGGNHGRPIVVATDVEAPHASLTYTDALVLAAIAPASVASAIGIDAETAPATRERVAAIYELLPAPRNWRRNDALRRWTRMEAVLKADGRGLRVDPRDVSIRKDSGGFLATVGDHTTTYAVTDLRVERRTIASLAFARPVSEPRPPAG